jgi:hypothetical protein
MATVLCVLYPDPVDGYPPRYVRDAIPVITRYADGQTAPAHVTMNADRSTPAVTRSPPTRNLARTHASSTLSA